ncbi:hypothetical protein [Paenibacillus popilliae]|nr:hypothetical protein [Paenibacillus popilliae]
MFSYRSSHLQQAATHMDQVLASAPGFLWALAGGLEAEDEGREGECGP